MKKNIKGIKPEIIAVVAIFLLVCIFLGGKSAMNIISALSYNSKGDTVPVNPVVSNELSSWPADEAQPQVAEPVSLTENPVKKVRAIVDNSALINDESRWYQAGDIVQGEAKILAIEASRILVEWNDTQSYFFLDYTVAEVPQPQPRQLGGQFNKLTDEQRARIQQGLQALNNLTDEQKANIGQAVQGIQSMTQLMQNMTPQERAQSQTEGQQMMQRFQNMTQEERQNTIQQLGRQFQQWLQSDQSQMPNLSLP
jgi:hypothetical protein